MKDKNELAAGIDPIDDKFKPVVMLKLRSGAVRYMVSDEHADAFAKGMADMECASKFFDVRLQQEGSPISLEDAAITESTVYFYLGKEAVIKGKTLKGEIGRVYRAIFYKDPTHGIWYKEYPYAFSNGRFGMVGRPIIDLSKVRLYSTAANAIIELLQA